MALKLFSRTREVERAPARSRKDRKRQVGRAPKPEEIFTPAPPAQLDTDPLKRLYQQGRYNVIVRDAVTWRDHPNGRETIDLAKRRLEEQLAFVPAGSVTLSTTLFDQPGGPEEESEVSPFLLDFHTVSNARFQLFVDDGGYDALEHWPEEIWPHLIELRDLTGCPGPRFWRNGRHNSVLANHPVVGLSWYEAQAFALWAGLRLPTEPEWQMAGSWHIKSSTDIMRRFPWGDAMDNARCNIWSSRLNVTAPVDAYPNGAAPNQVRQLIGNIWEWTDTEYNITDDAGRPVIGEMPMHAVRGGAFDTYFETQATNYFRTGQLALARSHNTGFRCAMDLREAVWISEA